MTMTSQTANQAAASRTLTTSKGMSVETTLTDREARDILAGVANKTDFARSLVSDFDRYGSLYPNKLAWLHKLAIEEKARQAEQEALKAAAGEVTAEGRFAALVSLFGHAHDHLKKPTVAFVLPAPGDCQHASGTKVSVEWRPLGDLRVKADGYTIAVINQRGTLTPAGWSRPETLTKVVEFLTAFAADPARVAKEHGRRTGRCCFCRHLLTDDRECYSVEMGYGPVCAAHWKMPWGKKEVTAAVEKIAERIGEVDWRPTEMIPEDAYAY